MGKPKHFGFARKTMACVMAASMLTLVTVPASVAIADNGAADTETQAMYRLYNPNSGEHFYTASDVEKDATVAAGWNYRGHWLACAGHFRDTRVQGVFGYRSPLHQGCRRA